MFNATWTPLGRPATTREQSGDQATARKPSLHLNIGLGFRVWDSGFRFGVWGLGFGPWALGLGPWALGLGPWGLGFGVWGLRFRDCRVSRVRRACWACRVCRGLEGLSGGLGFFRFRGRASQRASKLPRHCFGGFRVRVEGVNLIELFVFLSFRFQGFRALAPQGFAGFRVSRVDGLGSRSTVGREPALKGCDKPAGGPNLQPPKGSGRHPARRVFTACAVGLLGLRNEVLEC